MAADLFFPSNAFWRHFAMIILILFGAVVVIMSLYWKHIAPKMPFKIVRQDIDPNIFISVKITDPNKLQMGAGGLGKSAYITNKFIFQSQLNYDVTLNLYGDLFHTNKKIGELATKQVKINKHGDNAIRGWNYSWYPDQSAASEKNNIDKGDSYPLSLHITGQDTNDRKYKWEL